MNTENLKEVKLLADELREKLYILVQLQEIKQLSCSPGNGTINFQVSLSKNNYTSCLFEPEASVSLEMVDMVIKCIEKQVVDIKNQIGAL